MRVVTIIPARGGSKTIPRKNLMDFCGKPLVVWSIEQARNSKKANEVYVSTDDNEIADVSRKAGAVVINRPANISGDRSSSEAAILHALSKIRYSNEIDLIAFLQATSPVRQEEDIDGAIDQLYRERSDSLFSGTEIGDFYIWRKQKQDFKSINYDFRSRKTKQYVEKQYVENGSIYLFKLKVLVKLHNRLGGRISLYEMPLWKSYQIDDLEGHEICEYYMKTRILIN